MRVMGVDPGLTRCGIGIVSLKGGRLLEFEHVEVLRTSPADDLPTRLQIIGNSFQRIFESGTITELAIERVFVGQNLPSVMGVAQITGVVTFLARNAGIPVTTYTPNEVKSRVTGYGAADKSQVTNMVTKILGLKSPPRPADAADALALAITHSWALRGGIPKAATAPRSGLTKAQLAWVEAEKRSSRTGRKNGR